MTTANKNVNGRQKCQRQTKMSTAVKNAHGSALISFVSLSNSWKWFKQHSSHREVHRLQNVNDRQKCQGQTKMPTADKNAHGSALISFVSLNNSSKWFKQNSSHRAVHRLQNVHGRQKCQRQTKMSTADKKVNGRQKCQRQTKMSMAVH
jgi:hypothetical protein